MNEKRLGRNFIIFHPSDFSAASDVDFDYALKIAMQSKAEIDIMHVEAHVGPELYWPRFSGSESYFDALGHVAR
jgi:hypothetical protein